MNNPDLFPELNATKLESFAHTWAQRFDFIQRVQLYEKREPGTSPIKYLLCFDLSAQDRTEEIEWIKQTAQKSLDRTKNEDEAAELKDQMEKYVHQLKKEPNREFVKALEGPDGLIWLGTGPKDFKEVYRETPPDNFMDEWAFVTERPKGVTEEYSWLLSSRGRPQKEKKQAKRPCQRHREECRKVARRLWEEDPSITIADMIYDDDINGVCEGHNYRDRTLRDWIKDLCPDRSPGRRPEASKSS